MRRTLLLIALAMFSPVARADDAPFQLLATSTAITALQARLPTDKSATATFWSGRTTPLVEPGADPQHLIVTFLWRGSPATKSVVLQAQLGHTRDPNENALTHLADTDVWYRAYRLRSDLRFTYSFVVDGAPQRDPLNPRVAYERSLIELPHAAPQPWVAVRDGSPRGKLSQEDLASPTLKNQHATWTYVPPGYDPHAKPYPLLICFFGGQYVDPQQVAVPVTLDNLIAAHRIPPLVALFIDDPPGEGNQELRNRRAFADFMANEVVPWARKQWNITTDPRQTTLCGGSAGGLASGYLALQHPEMFGNVLSASGAFWRGNEGDEQDFEWVRQQFEQKPRLPVRFVLQVGMLEVVATPNNGPSIWEANHRLRDVLAAKGYDVKFSEEPAGHEPLNWRGGVADGLIYLYGSPR